jgi:hypothetical protein
MEILADAFNDVVSIAGLVVGADLHDVGSGIAIVAAADPGNVYARSARTVRSDQHAVVEPLTVAVAHLGVHGIHEHRSRRRRRATGTAASLGGVVDGPAVEPAHLGIADINPGGGHVAITVASAGVDFRIQHRAKVLRSIRALPPHYGEP